MKHYPRIEIHSTTVSVQVLSDGTITNNTPFHSVKVNGALTPDTMFVLIVGQVDNAVMLDTAKKIIHKAAHPKVSFFVEDCIMHTEILGDVDTNKMDVTIKADDDHTFIELDAIKILAGDLPFKAFSCEFIPGKRLRNYDFDIEYFNWFTEFNHALLRIVFDVPRTKLFKHSIVCLNNRLSTSRTVLSSILRTYDNVLVSSNFDLSEWHLKDARLDLPQKFKDKAVEGSKKHINTGDGATVNTANEQTDSVRQYQQGAVVVVTETRFFSDFANFTEKTLKTFIAARPFILVAPPKTLELLRNAGFKTFSSIIDESYDDEFDHSKRMSKILLEIDRIATMPMDELIKMVESVGAITEHNRQLFSSMRLNDMSHLKEITK